MATIRAWLGGVITSLAAMVIVVVVASSLLVAQPNNSGLNEPYKYAEVHTSLHGKIAALSHHDILKTTEPLLCSDGSVNFTCLLSKTDISPILRELRKIGVEPETAPVLYNWILVFEYNFTEGVWLWRNVTAVKSWKLRWNNETVYVFQTSIKKSLGEFIRLKHELSEAFFIKQELKNVTAIAIHADKIAVGTSNGTVINGKGKPDLKSVERIKRYIRGKYGDVKTEVYYTQGATPLVEMAGDYPVDMYFRSDGQYKYNGGGSCTLGFLGYLYGDPNLPVIITAWHCFGYVGTDRTSPYSVEISFSSPRCVLCRITAPGGGFFNPGPYYWGWYFAPHLFIQSDSALVGVREPNYFENIGLRFGYVRKADGSSDLLIGAKLGKYDVRIGESLWMRLGRSSVTAIGTVNSLCANFPPAFARCGDYPFCFVLQCHTTIGHLSHEPQPGDSGSPVYRIRVGPGGYKDVAAYGVLAGKFFDNVYIADISWINVKVSASR
jgi:hypothetical protein